MDSNAQKKLLDYLKNAIAIETDVATQEQMLAQFAQTHAVQKPTYEPKPEPESPHYENESNLDGDSKFLYWMCAPLMLIGGIVGFVYSGITGGFGIIVGLGCTAFAVWIFYHLIEDIRLRKEKEQSYNQSVLIYQAQKKKVNEENKKRQTLYWKYTEEWENSYNELYAVMSGPLAQTKDLLNKFYSFDTIYPKYRTLPALTSIYEYLVTGRCEELTGPHGAYNMYEDEIRKDTVISQLNTVIENLEQIRNNQYMLYQQVKEIQENTAAIIGELQQVKGYTIAIADLTALNTYYAALNERNSRITMYYHL